MNVFYIYDLNVADVFFAYGVDRRLCSGLRVAIADGFFKDISLGQHRCSSTRPDCHSVSTTVDIARELLMTSKASATNDTVARSTIYSPCHTFAVGSSRVSAIAKKAACCAVGLPSWCSITRYCSSITHLRLKTPQVVYRHHRPPAVSENSQISLWRASLHHTVCLKMVKCKSLKFSKASVA